VNTHPQAFAAADSAARIFIIDDNADGADSLAMLLELEGHATRAAHSAQQALAEIESFKPDVVLMDIGLPQMDGYELHKRLRELPSLTSTRFVAVTGFGQKEDRARTRTEGFDEHLVKPVSVEDLSQVLTSRSAVS
jgi:CheY-like chemotaxis protein